MFAFLLFVLHYIKGDFFESARKLKVNMFTMGRRYLRENACCSLQAVREGIQQTYPKFKDMNVDVAVNCEDAEIDDDFRNHWGANWKHMMRLAASQGGKDVLGTVKIEITKAKKEGRTSINIVIVSENGQRRSVGMAGLLSHCLGNDHDCEVTPVVHMSDNSPSWQQLCRNCEDCDVGAARAGPKRQSAYKIALDDYTKARETTPDQAYA